MASSSLRSVNPNAEIMGKQAALFMNINAAKGLQDVMKSNLGPKGTIKMLVGGAGGERRRIQRGGGVASPAAQPNTIHPGPYSCATTWERGA